MAKFYGVIGYVETSETAPGVWVEQITERHYAGDVLKISRRWQAGESLNDNLTVSNEISIVADPFAFMHFHTIKYAEWMGAFWEISNVEVQRPRLILTIGGVYNGKSTAASDST